MQKASTSTVPTTASTTAAVELAPLCARDSAAPLPRAIGGEGGSEGEREGGGGREGGSAGGGGKSGGGEGGTRYSTSSVTAPIPSATVTSSIELSRIAGKRLSTMMRNRTETALMHSLA